MITSCFTWEAYRLLYFAIFPTKDAAVYLQEGESNDRFVSHPKSWWSYLAYQLVHDEVYQYIQLAVSLLLMGLAIIEPPTFIDSTIIGPTVSPKFSVKNIYVAVYIYHL